MIVTNRAASRILLGLAGLVLVAAPLAAVAQSDLRNTFPGRRIGGGTRGECSARLLANLVPANSVFAPGSGATIGLLEGPTAQPRPLQLSFRPLNSAGTSAAASGQVSTRDLPAAPAGVVLLTVPAVKTATIWESGYRCEGGGTGAGAADGLDFVQSASPPALSLLVSDPQNDDKSVAAALKQLRSQCGKTVATASVAKTFGLGDAITPEWPQQLPVRCP
ncbi:MAG: hypothetical protein RLZZ336_1606 [Cyanobacteriota bacterium]|jgi:hypothetical protein